MAQLWAPKWLHLMLIYLWENLKNNCSNVYWKTTFLVQIYKWCGYEVDSEWITYIPLSSSLMKNITLPFPSSILLALYRKVYYPQMYTPNLPTPINTFCLAAVILLMWLRAYHKVKLLESSEFAQLKNHLKRRGYKESIIKKSFIKAHSISRSSLLQYKEKLKCKRTSCVLTYHPCLRNRFNTIRGHWTSVEKNSKLSKVFPEPPMVAFKHPNSLRNLLLRTYISKHREKSHSCGDTHFKGCKHMQHSSSYTSKVTGKQ